MTTTTSTWLVTSNLTQRPTCNSRLSSAIAGLNQTTPDRKSTPPQPLSGLGAVVTGASSGIGRQIALHFAAAGCEHLLVHYHRNRDDAESTAQEAHQHGTKVIVDRCDFSVPADADAFIDRAFAQMPRLSIWVHCAGVDVLTGEAANWTFDEKLKRLLDVDLLGSIRAGRDVGKRLREQSLQAAAPNPPTMIFISWDQATEGMEGDAGQMFSPVKAGVEAFAKSLAQDLAPHVRVNTLAPGWIQTAWGASTSDYWNRRAIDQSLMHRWGTPQDVADAAVFLASPASNFITGHTLPINGGWNRTYAIDRTQ